MRLSDNLLIRFLVKIGEKWLWHLFDLENNCSRTMNKCNLLFQTLMKFNNKTVMLVYCREQMRLFNDYQERCNKFYMQVVSQLCFENSTLQSYY